MGRPLPGYRVRAARCRTTRTRRKARSASTLEPRPTGLMHGYQADDGGIRPIGRRGLSHRRRRRERRRRLPHLCRPRRRRVQSVRLPHQPVRAGERADRASGGRRGGGGAVARSDAAGGAEGLSDAGRRATRRTAPRRCRSSSTAARRWRRSSGCAGSNSPNCRRRSPARSAASNCGGPKPTTSGAANARLPNSGKRIFPRPKSASDPKEPDP